MSALAPFAYPASGNVMVLGDGPELLVYSGANDQGIWKLMADDIIMGVGVSGDTVLSIDGAGVIASYRAIDGVENYRFETGVSPMSMEVSPDGVVCVVTASSMVLVSAGVEPVTVPWSSPRQVAWGPGSASLGVGGADGTFAAVDPVSHGAWGSVNLGAPVTGVVWVATGVWAVAHGQQISLVKGDGTEVLRTLALAAPVGGVAVSLDGAVLAAVVGDNRVAVYELQSDGFAGEVSYQRPVAAVRFGPGHWLAIAFDQGDANRLDVVGGTMTRTQAHPGRAQNAWPMNASVSHSKLRGAVANVAAGGAAIALRNQVKPVKKKGSWRPYAITFVLGSLFLLVFIGCGGGSFLYYYLRY